MRRFMLAAACGTLILAGCTDQQAPTEPSAPEPEALISGCTVTRFPLIQVSALIVKVFPSGRLRLEALARAGTIALLWNTCHPSAAQRAAVNFVNWMNANSAELIGTEAQRNQLINLILNSVGVPATVPEGASGDFGVGFFDPNSTTNTLVKTQSGTALVELPPGSFLEPTTIVIQRLTDNFELTNFDGNQFPPYFDYNAINASGIHDLEGNLTAIVGFCLFQEPDEGEFPEGNEVAYPPESNRRIGHNPVEGATNFPFEILDPVDLEAEGLADELNCPTNLPPYTPDPGPIGFGGGLSGFANAALHHAGSYLGPIARAIFLPQPLEATMLGTLPPPIGGRAPSLSPFGVVEVASNQVENFGTDVGAEGAGPYFVGEPLDACNEGCYPEYRIADGEATVTTPTEITVSLIPGEGSTGVLSGTTTRTTSATSPFTAEFDDLVISAPGTYQLLVSAPGATPYTSGSFAVEVSIPSPPLSLLGLGIVHSCALPSSGTPTCWGDNLQGQTDVPEGLTGVVSIDGGGAHTCALRNDGTVACWGRSSEGQTTTPEGLAGVAAVSAGSAHNCALTNGGTVTCWGFENLSEVDLGVTDVPEGLNQVVAVSAGGSVTCALRSNGSLVCWGNPQYGQIPVPAGMPPVKAIDVGDVHTCAVIYDGTVTCWGNNQFGESDVPAGLTGVVSVGSGEFHTCALKNNGTVTCWGQNEDGIGQTSVPEGLTGVTELSVGGYHNCALKSDGTVTCWGWNNAGQAAVPEGLNLGAVIGLLFRAADVTS